MAAPKQMPALLAPAAGVVALVALTVTLLPLTVNAAAPQCGLRGDDYRGVTYALRHDADARPGPAAFILDPELAAPGAPVLGTHSTTVGGRTVGVQVRIASDAPVLDLAVTGCGTDGRVVAMSGDRKWPDGTVDTVDVHAAGH